MRNLIFVVLLLVLSTSYADETYQCQSGEAFRTISVVYPYVGEKVPCEVRYQNATGEKVLWTAKKEVGYCEAKAKAFVAKQKEWGWACTRVEEQ